jgi:hypothetical protein
MTECMFVTVARGMIGNFSRRVYKNYEHNLSMGQGGKKCLPTSSIKPELLGMCMSRTKVTHLSAQLSVTFVEGFQDRST